MSWIESTRTTPARKSFIQCTTKTLNQCYGAGRAILKRISSFVDQMGRDCAVNDTQNLAHGLGMGSEQVP